MLRNATYNVLGSHKATSPELCKAQTFLQPGGRPEEISNTRQGRADEPIKCNEKNKKNKCDRDALRSTMSSLTYAGFQRLQLLRFYRRSKNENK